MDDFYELLDQDWDEWQRQHPDDDRSIIEVAESGDWEKWHDNLTAPVPLDININNRPSTTDGR